YAGRHWQTRFGEHVLHLRRDHSGISATDSYDSRPAAVDGRDDSVGVAVLCLRWDWPKSQFGSIAGVVLVTGPANHLTASDAQLDSNGGSDRLSHPRGGSRR